MVANKDCFVILFKFIRLKFGLILKEKIDQNYLDHILVLR